MTKRSERLALASLGTECAQLPEATHLVSAGLSVDYRPREGPDCLLSEPHRSLEERKLGLLQEWRNWLEGGEGDHQAKEPGSGSQLRSPHASSLHSDLHCPCSVHLQMEKLRLQEQECKALQLPECVGDPGPCSVPSSRTPHPLPPASPPSTVSQLCECGRVTKHL